MIPIPILKYVLKYFDGIDFTLVKRLERKKPQNEEGLTSDLCSLLDSHEQEEFALKYSIKDLIDDIQKKYPYELLLNFDLKTNEYAKSFEGKITQSDLGVIINYDNYYNRKDSWTEFWLFQAKVLKTTNINPIQYDSKSNFSSTSIKQLDKIESLTNILPFDFIRYMLYCPRLKSLNIPSSVKNKLNFLRDLSITKEIFDGNWRAELYKSIMDEDSELLNGGIFITPITKTNSSYGLLEIYKDYFKFNKLFSWFLVDRFNFNNAAPNRIYTNSKSIKIDESNLQSIAYGIVRGDNNAIAVLEKKLGLKKTNYTIYPERTLIINLRVGG